MRILVVEDDEATAAALKAGLTAERYSVDVENDGERGSYCARTNDYDLILLDNILPGKSGPAICAELRGRGISTPILMLSAVSETDKKIGALDCGADDYITKPYLFEEVSARVRALLRRPRSVEPAEICVGDLAIDRATFSASRGGRRIALNSKEFALLEYLMKNKGRVISRASILEHVWDAEADQFSKTVEAHIWRLRRKIDGGRPPGERLIRTVPGRGYVVSDGN